MTRVAFLGLGRMGAPMASNVAAGGHDLVLYNRAPAVAAALAERIGAAVAATPCEAAEGADIVLTMLADADAVREVYEGEAGVLAGLHPGTVAVDMGTTGPAGIARLARPVESAGGVLVDAPVSGSTAAAEAATLTIMVGASADAYARVQPVLSTMGRTIYHTGERGTASVAKLAVNNIIYALGNAVSESLVLAERAGLAPERVYEIFEHSAVAAPMVAYRRDAFLHPEDTPPAFAITLARKDLRLITELASSLGMDMEQAAANLALMDRAVAAGFGRHDMADVSQYLRGR